MSDLADAAYGTTGFEKSINRACLGRSVVRPRAEVQGTNLEGETVLLDLRTGHYYTLNRLGSAIWELCERVNSVEDMHLALCARFDVTPERALDDLVMMLNQLCQEDLIQVTTQ
jgi:hypothetical protein